MAWYVLSKCVFQIKVGMNHGQVGARMVKWRRNEGMLNGKWPHAKWQSALSAFCLFYTHSSITNISLQRISCAACVCARVLAVTCFSDHKTQKPLFARRSNYFVLRHVIWSAGFTSCPRLINTLVEMCLSQSPRNVCMRMCACNYTHQSVLSPPCKNWKKRIVCSPPICASVQKE